MKKQSLIRRGTTICSDKSNIWCGHVGAAQKKIIWCGFHPAVAEAQRTSTWHWYAKRQNEIAFRVFCSFRWKKKEKKKCNRSRDFGCRFVNVNNTLAPLNADIDDKTLETPLFTARRHVRYVLGSQGLP